MTRPSAEWPEYGGLEPSSERCKQIQNICSSTHLDYLEARALIFRSDRSELPPHTSYKVERARFLSGFDNLVVGLAFSDDVSWILRIPHCINGPDAAATRTCLVSEIFTMRIVRERTRIPVLQIFAFELSADQPFGHPFVLMEYLSGTAMPDRLVLSVPPQYLSEVAQQLADFLFELQGLTFDKIGRLWGGENADGSIEIIPLAWHQSPGPLDTSLEYFYNHRQGENWKISASHPHDLDWNTSCWVLKSALTDMFMEDRIRGSFLLCHYDHHCGNLLFDDEFNLVVVIDWSNAQAAPLEQSSDCPEFTVFAGLTDEGNADIVRFRGLIVDTLKQLETSPAPHNEDGRQATQITILSTYLVTRSAEIKLRCISHSPRLGLFAGQFVAKLVYGDVITWGQLKKVYGGMPIV